MTLKNACDDSRVLKLAINYNQKYKEWGDAMLQGKNRFMNPIANPGLFSKTSSTNIGISKGTGTH